MQQSSLNFDNQEIDTTDNSDNLPPLKTYQVKQVTFNSSALNSNTITIKAHGFKNKYGSIVLYIVKQHGFHHPMAGDISYREEVSIGSFPSDKFIVTELTSSPQWGF